MTKKPDINRLLELQRLLLQFSQVDRVIHRKHGDKMIWETDSEHSYNLAMTGWFLAAHFPELDRDTIIRLALVHDFVEVYAGDTFAYADEATLASKPAREKAAFARLTKEWGDFPDMLQHIRHYETIDTAEARFVYALDKLMPMMTVYLNDGYTWKKEGISLKQQHTVKSSKMALAPGILAYYEALHEILLASPDIIAAD